MNNQSKNIKKNFLTIVLYGDNMVGTTSLLRRYLYDTFDPFFFTRLTDFHSLNLDFDNGKKLKLHFWDIYHYRTYYNNIYFKKADGVMLTYDKTNRDSFLNIRNHLDEIKGYIIDDIPIALIGCKEDLYESEVITREEGEKFANDYNLIFFETSANTDYNVIESFSELISRIYEKNKNLIENNNGIYLRKQLRRPKKGCLK